MKLKSKIIVALDVDHKEQALSLAQELGPLAGSIKIGPRLTNLYGREFVQELGSLAPIFLDHKYFDIPSTMEAAVRSAFEMGASMVTVHAQAGQEALTRLAKVEYELNQKRPFLILAVTILTSFSSETLPEFVRSVPIEKQVMSLATLAIDSGLRGIVCSPHEAKLIRQTHSHAILVTPGIRSQTNTQRDDQARVLGAREAIQNGANYLVVGRPILESSQPKKVLQELVLESNQG